MENHQSPLGKRNQTGFNQKIRLENPSGKGEDSDEDEQVIRSKLCYSMNSSISHLFYIFLLFDQM